MDKTWMNMDNRQDSRYITGVNSFLDFAFAHAARGDKVRCPCYKCVNGAFHTRDVVFGHLILHGILKDYKWWSCHGEEHPDQSSESTDNDNREREEESSDEMHELDQEDWNWLINYWNDPKFKRISEANHANRSKQTMVARVGTMSIARTINNMRNPVENFTSEQMIEREEKPEYMRLWEKVRRKRDGSWVDKDAEDAYERMKELHDDQLKNYGKNTLSTEQAYTLALGHRSSYIRGMGRGPTPIESGGSRGQRIRAQVRAEMEKEMTTRIQIEVEERISQRDREAETRIAEMDERMSQKEKEAEARIAEMQAQMRDEMNSQMRNMME